MVKFTAPQDRVVHGPGKVTDRVTDRVTDWVTDGVIDRVTYKVTGAEKKVLIQLGVNPGYSYADLADKLNVSKKTIAEHIKSLKEKGIIQRVGNNKNGYWEIKI